MVMTALRKGASDGSLKYFLLSLLVLAGGGLVFTDVGGFFRGGTLGNTKVAKIGGEEISLVSFDRKLGGILRNIGISPQEALQRGFINQLLTEQITTSVMQQSASGLGIKISKEKATDTIKKIIEPNLVMGGNPSEILSQILRMQGMTETEFVGSIQDQTAVQPLATALKNVNYITSKQLENDILAHQSEERDIEYVILKNSDVKNDTPIEDSELLTAYERSKEEFASPETRSFTVLEVIYEVPEGSEISEDEQLDEQYAIADAIDDMAASGASIEDISEEVSVKKTTYKALSAFDKDADSKLLQEAFALEEGEISPTFEQTNGTIAALTLTSITPKSYKPFEEVKSTLTKREQENRKALGSKLMAIELTGQIKRGEKKLANAGTVKSLKKLTRTGSIKKPFIQGQTNELFNAAPGTPIAIPVEDGTAITVVTKTHFPATPSKENKKEIQKNLKEMSANEAMMLYLENKRQGMKIKINEDLLTSVYSKAPDEQY